MAEKKTESVFDTLAKIDVNEHTEQKNGLTYLSWAWAWAELKKHYPEAVYTVYENSNGCIYHTDGRTAWVKTGVTVNGIEHIEYLPVMDNRNNSIPIERITSFDANKAVQRSLTKAISRFGLGLYIYAGEDLPIDACICCDACGKEIEAVNDKYGNILEPAAIVKMSKARFGGKIFCPNCQRKLVEAAKAKREEKTNA